MGELTLNIDTSQFAGGDSEKARVWGNFAMKHLEEMRVLKRAGLLGGGNRAWRNVPEHVLVVAAVASHLARLINSTGREVNGEMVETAAILHDASKRRDVESGVRYDEEQKRGRLRDLLGESGYSAELIKVATYTARVPEIYLSEEEQDKAIANRSLEQLIVAYADARVRNVLVVSLGEARDGNKKKNPKDAEFYDRWYEFYQKVEKGLSSAMGLAVLPGLTNEGIFEGLQQRFTKTS